MRALPRCQGVGCWLSCHIRDAPRPLDCGGLAQGCSKAVEQDVLGQPLLLPVLVVQGPDLEDLSLLPAGYVSCWSELPGDHAPVPDLPEMMSVRSNWQQLAHVTHNFAAC